MASVSMRMESSSKVEQGVPYLATEYATLSCIKCAFAW